MGPSYYCRRVFPDGVNRFCAKITRFLPVSSNRNNPKIGAIVQPDSGVGPGADLRVL